VHSDCKLRMQWSLQAAEVRTRRARSATFFAFASSPPFAITLSVIVFIAQIANVHCVLYRLSCSCIVRHESTAGTCTWGASDGMAGHISQHR
jgi:hypothetical protein